MAVNSLVFACSLLAAASAASVPHYFQKRWDTSLCASNPGVAIPDSDTLQLPLENYRSDLCWGLVVGSQSAPTATSQICYTFSGANLIFNYAAIPGYTYTETDIYLGLSAPSGSPQSQYTSGNGACTISADATTASCTIPYSSIITSGDVLSGMCPNGDSAGLTFYLYTNAVLNNNNGTGSASATGRLSCADYPTCSSYLPDTYWELYYRCTDCPSASSSTSMSSSAPPSSPSSSSTPVGSVTPTTSSSIVPSSPSSFSSVSPVTPSTSSTLSSPPSSSVPSSSPSSAASSSCSSSPVSPTTPTLSSSIPPSSSSPAATPSTSSILSNTPVSPVTPSSSASPVTPSSTSSKPSSSPTKPSPAPASSSPCTTGPNNHPSPPMPSSATTYCTFGTAFGYSNACSHTFQSMDRCPNTCQRWGWYENFSIQQISNNLSGPLYVGAGGNDQSRAINVGSWSAQTQRDGKIYVQCSVGGGYSLGEVMVDVGCTPISSCDSNEFDITATPSKGATSFTTGGIAVPSCGRNGSPYVIVQATIESAHTVWGFPGFPGSYSCDKPICT